MEIRHVELQDYQKLGFKDCGGFIIDVPGYEQPMEMMMIKAV